MKLYWGFSSHITGLAFELIIFLAIECAPICLQLNTNHSPQSEPIPPHIVSNMFDILKFGST